MEADDLPRPPLKETAQRRRGIVEMLNCVNFIAHLNWTCSTISNWPTTVSPLRSKYDLSIAKHASHSSGGTFPFYSIKNAVTLICAFPFHVMPAVPSCCNMKIGGSICMSLISNCKWTEAGINAFPEGNRGGKK